MTARSLVLLRHAKADAPRGVADEDRPLSARGQADAHAAGGWLAGRQVPELVLCSPAKRTRQTWHAVAASLPADAAPVVRYERRLYLGDPDSLLELVQEVEDPVTRVLVIGHNPTLSQLVFTLDPEAGGLDSDGLRTCGLTVHELDGPWSGCGPRHAPVTATHTARGT
ncbi:MAG: histidine phosphatase family protein [Micromonosporaceae bacterium]|nr:histidine phosphatase family protein [Micromonosporaceae bacterium]